VEEVPDLERGVRGRGFFLEQVKGSRRRNQAESEPGKEEGDGPTPRVTTIPLASITCVHRPS
jgi:hypothetical protein